MPPRPTRAPPSAVVAAHRGSRTASTYRRHQGQRGATGRVRKQHVASSDGAPPPTRIICCCTRQVRRAPTRPGADADADAGGSPALAHAHIGDHMKRSSSPPDVHDLDRVRHGPVDARRRAKAALGMTALPSSPAARSTRCASTRRSTRARGRSATPEHAVNLGIAVSLGEDGLIVPVIRDAQASAEGLGERASATSRGARAAASSRPTSRAAGRSRSRTPAVRLARATPIINQPQVAILDLEAVVSARSSSPARRHDAIAIRPMTTVPVVGPPRARRREAARFLGALRRRPEAWPVGDEGR